MLKGCRCGCLVHHLLACPLHHSAKQSLLLATMTPREREKVRYHPGPGKQNFKSFHFEKAHFFSLQSLMLKWWRLIYWENVWRWKTSIPHESPSGPYTGSVWHEECLMPPKVQPRFLPKWFPVLLHSAHFFPTTFLRLFTKCSQSLSISLIKIQLLPSKRFHSTHFYS